VDHLDAGHGAEQFAGKVPGRADADRGERELAGVRLRRRDQVGDRLIGLPAFTATRNA
jgi:hypothetical protein